jgi:hypothetical protein
VGIAACLCLVYRPSIGCGQIGNASGPVGATAPAAAQKADADRPYIVVWLTGESGHARAGVVVPRNYKALGDIVAKDGTTVATPDGHAWDLSTLAGFLGLNSTKFPIVSSTGSVDDATVGSALSGYLPISTKIDTRQNLVAGGSKVGTVTAKGTVTGFLAFAADGSGGSRGVLLPIDSGYRAAGTIVTSDTGAGKHEEVAQITGAILGLVNGQLALGLSASTPAGQHVTYVIPDFVNAAFGRDVYQGPIYRDDSFGFAKTKTIGSADALGVTGPKARTNVQSPGAP